MDSGLIVSEIFGPTVQGEGPSLGRRTHFLRLGICNLACTWCDTDYTWDWRNFDYKKELERLSVEEILKRLEALGPTDMLVVTGGEPLLQKHKLALVLETVALEWGWDVEVETSGTIDPTGLTALVKRFNVSPKLSNSGNSLIRRRRLDVLNTFNNDISSACFKFVVSSYIDLLEVAELVEAVGIDNRKVYIMPEGITSKSINCIASTLADEVIRRGWNLTTRLHVLLWGNKRRV